MTFDDKYITRFLYGNVYTQGFDALNFGDLMFEFQKKSLIRSIFFITKLIFPIEFCSSQIQNNNKNPKVEPRVQSIMIRSFYIDEIFGIASMFFFFHV